MRLCNSNGASLGRPGHEPRAAALRSVRTLSRLPHGICRVTAARVTCGRGSACVLPPHSAISTSPIATDHAARDRSEPDARTPRGGSLLINATRHRWCVPGADQACVAVWLALVAWGRPVWAQDTADNARPISYGAEITFGSGHADRGFIISDRPVLQPVTWVTEIGRAS